MTLDENSKHNDLNTLVRIQAAEVMLRDEFNDFQQEQLQNFYLASGYILSAADLQKLIKEKRPHFQSNLFNHKVLQLSGNFVENLPGIDILGVNQDDHAKAQIFRSLNDYILHTANNIEYELAKAYIYAIIGRISWVGQEWNFKKNPLGMVDVYAYTPFLKFDTSVTDMLTMKDMNYISDQAWLSSEEICAIYARKNDALKSEIMERSKNIFGESTMQKKQLATWAEKLHNLVVEYGGELKGYDATEITQTYDKYGTWHNKNGKLNVIDWYERRETPVMYINEQMTGKRMDVSEIVRVKDTYDKDWYDNDKLQYILQTQFIRPKVQEDYESRVYQISIVPGLNLVLYNGQQQLQNKNFKFSPVLCYNFHPNIMETKSVIDHIKDPVRSYNLRDNTNLTYLMRATHGGEYVEESAITGKEAAIKNGNKIGSMTVLNNGAISGNKIKPKDVPNVDFALEKYQDRKMMEIDQISGVGLNAQGQQESQGESGKLFNLRIQQSDIMQGWVVQNANNALIQLAKNNLFYIQKFMKEERSFRIEQEFGDPYWLAINRKVMGQVINDVTVGEYDVRISKVPFGKAAREMDYQKALQITEILMQLNPAFVDPKEIVKLSTLSNRDAWIKRIEMVEGQQEAQVQQQLAIEQQQREAEEEKNILDYETQMIQADKQVLDNLAMVGDLDFESILKQVGGNYVG